jgi:hypothetical protein
MKHPETEIRCEGCKRLWAEIQPKVGGWKPFASKCKNCGVPK